MTKVFDERPENVVDIFEDVSRKVKQETFVSAADTIRDEFEPSTEFNLAEIQKPLFDKSAEQDAEMVTSFKKAIDENIFLNNPSLLIPKPT